MVQEAISYPRFISPVATPAKIEVSKRVHYKVPTYKKADKINQNILNYKDNQKHIFRYKALDRIYIEIAREILQGQNLLPFDGLVFKREGINLYLNVYKSEPYEWVNFKTKKFRDFRGENFIIVQAEIEGTEFLPIYKRLKIHIELLRQLRQGVKIKKAVRIAKRKTKTIL